MTDLINKDEFLSGKPFAHIMIDDFLAPEIAAEILERLSAESFEYKESDLFTFKQTPMLRYEDFLAFLEGVLKPEIEEITGVKIGDIDMHGSLYEDTDHLLCHDDQLEDRVIAYLLYLSDVDEADGGALTLYDEVDGKPGRVVKRIQPKFNRLVLFRVSDISFHAVEEVITDTQRIAIGGWFHAQ